ncbi:RagB/SusD family nutrient uptake outer membrane protein [Sinomicrobium oceani]|uniref:RagB/SusD family nutrient uptake outer membrane protein n=1 Tax=Sinomicrobium oceani TaxID=1150368 RepID=UPI00227CFB77|nr:RagB/SusD family nutrient uptake outer membrane protein [Sinomicrobium oceani]
MKSKYTLKYLALFCAVFFTFSCEDFLDPGIPKSDLISTTVFTDDASAEGAITGLYHGMMSAAAGGYASGHTQSVTSLCGISADLLSEYSTGISRTGFFENTILPQNTINFNLWSDLYQNIYRTNAALEGLEISTELTPDKKQQLEGEAYFIRAFTYFYLVNLYGEVPLLQTTDYRQNATASKNSVDEIYHLIIADLEMAEILLPNNFSPYSEERIRVNQFGAKAMLARVYLYLEDWIKAEQYASEVISSPLFELYHQDALDEVFMANSSEAIWQLFPIHPSYNTYEGYIFVLENDPSLSSFSSMALSPDFVETFEVDDQRRFDWISYFDLGEVQYPYPFKYKVKSGSDLTEYSMVLRLAEQYLIRGEARLKQGNLPGAKEDLNRIRHRAGLLNTNATTPEAIMDAIMEERKKELFTEWGHRWLDLKRTKTIGKVLGELKPLWDSHAELFPIPEQELLDNPNLTPNPGY